MIGFTKSTYARVRDEACQINRPHSGRLQCWAVRSLAPQRSTAFFLSISAGVFAYLVLQCQRTPRLNALAATSQAVLTEIN